jgi:predicted hydrocarbon binding protein
MTNEETGLEEVLHTTEDETFVAFMIIRSIYFEKKKKRISNEEIYFVYKNYARLLAERKQMLGYKERLETLNNFMGLR